MFVDKYLKLNFKMNWFAAGERLLPWDWARKLHSKTSDKRPVSVFGCFWELNLVSNQLYFGISKLLTCESLNCISHYPEMCQADADTHTILFKQLCKIVQCRLTYCTMFIFMSLTVLILIVHPLPCTPTHTHTNALWGKSSKIINFAPSHLCPIEAKFHTSVYLV